MSSIAAQGFGFPSIVQTLLGSGLVSVFFCVCMQRLGVNNVTVTNPGNATCGGANGTLPEGTYILNQTAPAGATFYHWECWNITNGTAVGPFNSSSLNLTRGVSFTCVAVYNITAAAPQLALLSQFPSSYTGPTANLTAAGPSNSTCTQAPSQRLGVNNVTIVSPGAGACSATLAAGLLSLRWYYCPTADQTCKALKCVVA